MSVPDNTRKAELRCCLDLAHDPTGVNFLVYQYNPNVTELQANGWAIVLRDYLTDTSGE